MKTGKENALVLYNEVKRQSESKLDIVAPTNKLRMVAEEPNEDGIIIPEIITNIVTPNGDELPQDFTIRPTGHEHISGFTKIHKKYYDLMLVESPELLAINVNHWFNKNPDIRMVRTLDSSVRAMLSPRYRIIDNFDLANVIFQEFEKFNGSLILASSEITERKMYMKFVLPDMKREVRVGDVHSAGVIVSNSEIGHGRVKIDPFIYRWVCKNGMISPEAGLRKNHVGRALEEFEDAVRFFADETRQADDRAFMLKVRDVFRAVLSGEIFESQIDLLIGATQNKITGNVQGAVEVVSNKFMFTEDERSRILDNLIKSTDLTQFGLANAITQTAETVESYDRATEFEKFGGEVIVLPNNEWNSIATASAPEEKKRRGRKAKAVAA